MLLYEIEKNPTVAFDYLERQVNNGSKSGFTSIHNTSIQTNPFYSDGYHIMKLASKRGNIECFGTLNCDNSLLDNDESIFIHPDWLLPQNIETISDAGIIEESLWVIPTSSSRTVHVEGSDIYIKLHYPGIIGRLNRVLGFQQLISGIEITSIFDEAYNNNQLPDYFAYMPESYGKLLRNGQNEIGYIVRELPKTLKDFYLVPGFSLFSYDRNVTDAPQLLIQILAKSDSPREFFLEEICFKLVDIFFWCALEEGLIPEMHSQNIVFAFNKEWGIEKIILRDFESIDKDISIRCRLGKHINFEEHPYKCITNDDKNYLKRHSFMYDHKLGEYLLDPLIECAASSLKIRVEDIRKNLRDYVQRKYGDIINNFFPADGCWYKYPDEEIDRSTDERPFISMGRAIYKIGRASCRERVFITV